MLPISLRPNGRRAVIVGGGSVAARKAESLVDAGFPIFVVAERIDDRLRSMLDERGEAYEERRYESADVEGAALVIAATADPETNARVVFDARAARTLVCDAAQPHGGDFTMAATQRIGDLTITADSGGGSPAFARRVVGEMARALGPQYGDAVRTLARMRTHVKEAYPQEERAEILRELAAQPVEELAAMPAASVICASRRSALATVQSRSVAARLAQRGIASTILGVTTSGDRDQKRPIDELDGPNVFVKELESALRERRADYAVHSCKDLASSLPGDMCLAAVSQREDARDAFCSERYASLDALPPGAVVGTSSPRRQTQLLALRPDLTLATLRGNVDTRLRKLRGGEFDAIVLAMAGLNRLGLRAAHVVPFDVETLVPAAGQGALAVETRAGDDALARVLRACVGDAASELRIACERAALRALHAGCSAPIGIHARLEGERMVAIGAYATDGANVQRERCEARVSTLEEAEALGAALAARFSEAMRAAPEAAR